ncbi:MAG: hypothetical protein HFE97_10110 [Oscillospiraceae bacterium]|nr:hypothetical protein [Oscillospiraceae bacterium]
MIIRQETDKDYEEIYTLVTEAFATAEHTDGREQELVAALRKEDAFIPKLSLVAELDGAVIGHILFTKCAKAINGTAVYAKEFGILTSD